MVAKNLVETYTFYIIILGKIPEEGSKILVETSNFLYYHFRKNS
jgi:hypothetical protein